MARSAPSGANTAAHRVASLKRLNAQLLAASTLMASSAALSKLVDSFGVWLLAGFGAAVALLLANLDAVEPIYLPAKALGEVLMLLLWALGLAVLQRYLGIGVQAGAETFERTLGRIGRVDATTIDWPTFNAEIARAYPPPWRWVTRWAQRRAEAGDATVAARLVARLAVVQGLLVLAEVAVIGYAVYAAARVLSMGPS